MEMKVSISFMTFRSNRDSVFHEVFAIKFTFLFYFSFYGIIFQIFIYFIFTERLHWLNPIFRSSHFKGKKFIYSHLKIYRNGDKSIFCPIKLSVCSWKNCFLIALRNSNLMKLFSLNFRIGRHDDFRLRSFGNVSKWICYFDEQFFA